MAFDPCREWLGIDAVDLGEPTRVLGLPLGCRDAAAIAAAAEARLDALRRVTPGPFAKAHAALVARVEEARDTLLATAFSGGAAAPPREPVPGVFSPPPPPGGVAASRWQARADDPGVSPSPSGFQPAADPVEPAFDAAVRRSVARPRSSSGAGGLLLTSLALLGAAVAVIVFLTLNPDPFGRQVAVKPPVNPTSGGKPGGGKPAGGGSSVKPGQTSTTRPSDRPTNGGTAAADAEREAREAERRREAMEREAREREAREREQQEAERRRQEQEERARRDAEMAKPKAPPETTDGKEGEQTPEEMAKQQAAAEEARRREAMAAEAAKQATDEERLKMQAALDKSLGEVFTALQRGEFDTADRTIKASEALVGDDVEAATRIERWRLLATYAREFVGFREQAIAAANAGRDYEVEGTRFAVIEITPELFVYKLAGDIKRVPRERVDPRIELAVVEGWFEADGRAANHLFLGARWLCLDPPNLQRARREWQIAGDGGEQVAPLTALLDDPVVRRAAR